MQSKPFCLISLFFALLTIAATSCANTQALTPTDDHSKAMIEVVERLALMHYQNHEIDDEMSESFLKHYLDDLDPSKSYFLQDDIDEFSQWTHLFDDLIKQGNLEAGFAVYNRYRQRAINRWESNLALLKSDFAFDFELDESVSLDTDARTWHTTSAEADEYWRKVIKDALLRLLLSEKEPVEARELLIKRYEGMLTQLSNRDAEDAFTRFANTFTSLYGPHTTYMSPRMAENFRINISLSLEGIGAVLQTEDEHTKVVSIVPKGPADKGGALHPGDKISAVGQDKNDLVDVIGWRLDDVVQLIRGAKGTTVRLEVIPAKGDSSSSKVISIVRDKIELEEQSAQSRILEIDSVNESPSRFGVIELPTFYLDMEDCRFTYPSCKNTTSDVKKLIDELIVQDIDGIILDLRNNGGGPLHEATMLTDVFIDSGPVVQIRSANQRISRQQRSRHDAYYRGPLIVLINRLSASASEIFAGAVQDYGRGLVVGSQSFGKGTVQSTSDIQGGLIKLTESKFYRVSGDSTQNRGIIPDIQLPSLYDHSDVGESSDPLAMEWDKITAVPHRKYFDFSKNISLLQEFHNNRLKDNPDLRHMTQEVDLFRSRRNQKVLSLNYQQRLNEKAAYEASLLKLENTRRTAKDLPAFENYKAWVDADSVDEETEQQADKQKAPITSESDPLLYETGRIFVDHLLLTESTTPKLVAHQQ